MKNHKLRIIILILVVFTAIFSVLHFKSREVISEDCVQLIVSGKTYEIAVFDLECEKISGVRVNGKGEEISVEGQGIFLNNLLKKQNIQSFNTISVVSDDSYNAKIVAEEIEKAAFLVEDNQLRLVVFGDKDSKRSVSNIKQIIIK